MDAEEQEEVLKGNLSICGCFQNQFSGQFRNKNTCNENGF